MSKRQRLSFFHLEGLPDEVLLKIFSLLDIKGVLQCGQVSNRLRNISNDQSLWLKLNLSEREVPFDFIVKAVENGCEYLNLRSSWVTGVRKLEVPWKLKYLEMSQYFIQASAGEDLVGVLQNCHFLQKLVVDGLKLNSETMKNNEIEQICQNGKTLQILSLDICNIDFYHRTELITKLLTRCPQLTELNFGRLGSKILLDSDICALVDNLPSNILKLNLRHQECVNDKYVNTLVSRCKRITELDLSYTNITNDSLKGIIKHLNYLEKLDISCTNIEFSMILQLKSTPTLKILKCQFNSQFQQIQDYIELMRSEKLEAKQNTEKIKYLRLQLPHISINEGQLYIAGPNLWETEIRAKQQNLFFQSTLVLGPPGSPDGP